MGLALMSNEPIISPLTRIRHPEHFAIGPFSIVDDFCYFSTRVTIGVGSHIASGCSVAGGVARDFTLGDYSSLSSGVKVWCTSDDFVHDIVTICPDDIKKHLIEGDVAVGHYTAIGSNSVIMPANTIPEGVAIGALSFVPPRFPFEPWTVYAGTPIRRIKKRNEASVRAQVVLLDAFHETMRGSGKGTMNRPR